MKRRFKPPPDDLPSLPMIDLELELVVRKNARDELAADVVRLQAEYDRRVRERQNPGGDRT